MTVVALSADETQLAAQKTALSGAALAATDADYREQVDLWKIHDGKAQSTFTVAGLFLAALIALLKELSANARPGYVLLLITSLGCFLVAVIVALVAMRVREAPLPNASKLNEVVAPILAASRTEEALEEYLRYLGTRRKSLEACIQALSIANASKATAVFTAQVLLMLGVTLSTITLAVFLITK